MASLCHGQNFTCPVDGNGDCKIGLYPDPQSCAHYYNCVPDLLPGCVQNKEQCSQFYAFHKGIRQCVLAVDAECDGIVLCYIFHCKTKTNAFLTYGKMFQFDSFNATLVFPLKRRFCILVLMPITMSVISPLTGLFE